MIMVNPQPTPTPTTDPAASKNMGAIFLKKKSACGNVVSRSGLPEIPGAILGSFLGIFLGVGVPGNPRGQLWGWGWVFG